MALRSFHTTTPALRSAHTRRMHEDPCVPSCVWKSHFGQCDKCFKDKCRHPGCNNDCIEQFLVSITLAKMGLPSYLHGGCYRWAWLEMLLPAGPSATAVCASPLSAAVWGQMVDPVDSFCILQAVGQVWSENSSFSSFTSKHTNIYLSFQALLVIVEKAEAVEFVLRRRAARMTAPAARLMSGLRPRRWSLKWNNVHTVNTSSLHRLTKDEEYPKKREIWWHIWENSRGSVHLFRGESCKCYQQSISLDLRWIQISILSLSPVHDLSIKCCCSKSKTSIHKRQKNQHCLW